MSSGDTKCDQERHLWKILHLRRNLSEVREEKYFRLLDAAVTAGMRRSEQWRLQR